MTRSWHRRCVVRMLLAAGVVGLAFPTAAWAQTDDALARAKSAGSIKVGLANQPPYSGLNPDGTLTGYVPKLVERIMASLGVPKVEGFVASYGELIPGLQAGRWDMIAASFRITKQRCEQVRFADPVTFDGGAIAYVPSQVADAPKSIADIGKAGLSAGILQGSYLIRVAEAQGVEAGKISQFPNNPSLIDGLLAKRVQVVVSTNASLLALQKARGGAFEIVYPLPDDPPVGSAPAFRMQDTTLHEAFQKELRALREKGELDRMSAEFGFAPPPDDLKSITAEEACARVN